MANDGNIMDDRREKRKKIKIKRLKTRGFGKNVNEIDERKYNKGLLNQNP